MRTYLKIRRALATGGVARVLKLGALRLSRRRQRRTDESLTEFDLRYGTNTSGSIDQLDLDTHAFGNWMHGEKYQPAVAGLIGALVSATGIDPAVYTFVDLGCGKGRMVLAAVEAGFGNAIGVDFSQSLLRIAAENARAFRARFGSCNAEFRCADASAFELPEGRTVAFLYNPFGAPVMSAVAQRAAARRRADGEQMLIWYHNPAYGDCWDKAGFERIAELPEIDTIVWSR